MRQFKRVKLRKGGACRCLRKKQKEKRSKEVGFVERNRNDYNIVYRNKPSKPLTVSELFGIKNDKNEEKNNESKNIIKEENIEKRKKKK